MPSQGLLPFVGMLRSPCLASGDSKLFVEIHKHLGAERGEKGLPDAYPGGFALECLFLFDANPP